MQGPRDYQAPAGQENCRRGDKGWPAIASKARCLLRTGLRLRWQVCPSRPSGGRPSGGESALRRLRGAAAPGRPSGAIGLGRAFLLLASAFFRFIAFSLQAGASLGGPLPVLTFLLLADAFLGGEFFQLAGEFFRRAFLLLAGPLLGRALLLCEFLYGAFPFLLDGALLLRGALALGRAFLLDGALLLRGALALGRAFLLCGTLSLLLCGAFPLLPGPFLLSSLLCGALLL
jgi:hypothetical protein